MEWQIAFVFLFPIITQGLPEVTLEPQPTPTGILSQFQGFRTPRPFPPNANFMYASVWASWSAWSFCANGVQVRVRACNTVKGFSCLGANRETKDCENPSRPLPLPQPGNQAPRKFPTPGHQDYDVQDPWDDDRKEALKQLGQYSDYEVPELKNQKPHSDLKLLGEKTIKNFGPRGPERLPQNKLPLSYGPAQAPSMTPEKLYGSKTNTRDSVLSLPTTPPTIPTTTSLQATTSVLPSVESQSISETTQADVAVTEKDKTIELMPTTENFRVPEQNDNVEIVSSLNQHFKGEGGSMLEVAKPKVPISASNFGVASINEEPIASVIEEEVISGPRTQSPLTTHGRTSISVPVSPPPAIILHDQKVTLPPPLSPQIISKNTHEEDDSKKNSGVLNKDTFKALEWMLNNMTNAAKQADSSKVHEMNLESPLLHSGEVIKTFNANHVTQKSFASRIHKIPAPLVDNDGSDILGNEKILHEELIRLKTTMDQVESELKELEHDEIEAERPQFNEKKAISLSLVPQIPKGTDTQDVANSSPEILDQDQRKAIWTNWGPWGNCLCGKQMRTRTCHYGVYSGGCVGRSYQTRVCRSYDDSCPNATHSHENGIISTLHEGSAVRRLP